MKIPDGMEKYINDYKIQIFEVAWLTEEEIERFQSDFRIVANFFTQKRKNKDYIPDDPTEIKRYRDVVEISQSMFVGSYDGLRENRKIETESFMMAGTFTHTNIRREDLPEGDEINMCKAMDQLFQRMRNEGESIGIEKGRQEEKQSTLKELLKVKLGTLSSPLEKQLTNTSLEKLNVLILNIFNINSEEDVLKIIN